MTDLEAYFSRSLGLALLLLAALNLLLTGAVPLSTRPAPVVDGKNPYVSPTLVVTTIYHALTGFYIYATLQWGTGGFALGAGLLGSSLLFCVGMWTILFGGAAGHMSKKTGADKRTSNFPFENRETAKEVKRRDKERDSAEKETKRREKERDGSDKERDKDKDKEKKKRSVARSSSSKGLW